jgi:hypothetical protein
MIGLEHQDAQLAHQNDSMRTTLTINDALSEEVKCRPLEKAARWARCLRRRCRPI